jgi:transporter family-2 protein
VKPIEPVISIARLEFLAALTGILIATQARSNGELAHLIQNPTEAALLSFSSGLLIISLVGIFSKKVRAGVKGIKGAIKAKKLAKWPLFAGALGGCVIGIQTQVVPLIGVALYSVASISGQTAISLVVDRIGLTGGGKKHISGRRIVAAALTITAVFVSVIDKLSLKNFAILSVLLTVAAGSLVGIQRSFNGLLNEHSRQSFATSLLNFITGTSTLLLILGVMIFIRHDRIHSLPPGPWWIYLGGVTGVIYIAFASTIVQHLGVLTFTLFSVGGQLFGSLLIDLISPTHNAHVTWYLVIGILLTYAGVLAGGQSRLFRR